MSDPQYKLVDGVLVELTPEEIAAREAEIAKQKQSMNVASTKLDMGLSMFEILNGAVDVRT